MQMAPDEKNPNTSAASGSSSEALVRALARKGIAVPQLQNELHGEVIAPEDAGYDEARTVFYGGIDRRPAVIIRPADAAEASRVVSLARDGGLELAVRSGGHSVAGYSVTEGGIVLDLSRLRGLDIDVDR